MDRFASWLTELPFHLVFIAHTYEKTRLIAGSKRDREVYQVDPLFVGVQRTSVPNKFDNVWHTTTMGGGRSQSWGIQPEKGGIYAGKTRVGGILDPDYEQDPNLTDIIEEFSKYAKTLEEE